MMGVLLSPVAPLIPPQVQADSSSQLIELVDAAAERLEVADPVAAFKWSMHSAIEDPARVEQQLTKLRDDATSEDIDPEYVTRVFRDQISATEAIQYSRFADWKLNPPSAPAEPPDLSVSRSAIDALNHKILSQIGLNWNLLAAPSCAAQLDRARRDTIGVRHFDGLYQRALTRATQSYCQVPLPA
nr:chorismate mutase [Mycobacterium decipiens]